MEQVAEFGINHIDTAAVLRRLGGPPAAVAGDPPGDVFLATKTGERRGDRARAELERSLQRMNVDHVDLIQLHNLVEEDEWEVAHGPDGAVEALVRARDEGLVRFIGVTGHGTRIAHMHLASLDRFPFDSVLLPYNHSSLLDPGYEADVRMLLERCAEQQVAVQTIKSIARRRWPDDATEPRLQLVSAVARRGSDRGGRCDSCSRIRSCSSTPAATPRCCRRSSRRPPARSIARATRSSSADEERFDITPLFDGDALERI